MSFKSVRRIAAAVACAAVVGVASPGIAGAQTVGSSEADVRQGAWDARNAMHNAANGLPPELAAGVKTGVDQTVNGLFPGLIESHNAPAPAPAPEAPAPALAPEFDRGSCPPQARACVDLSGERTWLQRNGQVVYGAVPMSAGAPSPETATPKGTFYVQRKVKDEISREFNNAPMPYSTYFTNTGIAFHSGDINLWSHGCIHLNHQDAITYFNDLQPGDMVYVY